MTGLLYILLITLGNVSNWNVRQDMYPIDLSGKVIGIIDGDTIDILYLGKPLRIRFSHIDCPEIRKKQPYGSAAKKFTSDFCFGQTVRILHHNEMDRSKRLIAELITKDGRNLNQELVKAGLAWHFTRYSNHPEYARLEDQARKERRGLWKEPDPVAPWNWRRPK